MRDAGLQAWLKHRTFSAHFHPPTPNHPQPYRQTGELQLLTDDSLNALEDTGSPTGDTTAWAYLCLQACHGGGFALTMTPMNRNPQQQEFVLAAWTIHPDETALRIGLAKSLATHYASLRPDPLADPQW